MTFSTKEARSFAPRLRTGSPGPIEDATWSGRARLNGKRLHQSWTEFLGRLPWEILATLTFDPKRMFSVSLELADREVFWWLGVVGRLFRRPIGWAYVVERHASGRHHAHALIIGAGKAKWQVPKDVWHARNGFADIRPVRDERGVALYTGKSTALGGEVVLADTLGSYRPVAQREVVVQLEPQGDRVER